MEIAGTFRILGRFSMRTAEICCSKTCFNFGRCDDNQGWAEAVEKPNFFWKLVHLIWKVRKFQLCSSKRRRKDSIVKVRQAWDLWKFNKEESSLKNRNHSRCFEHFFEYSEIVGVGGGGRDSETIFLGAITCSFNSPFLVSRFDRTRTSSLTSLLLVCLFVFVFQKSNAQFLKHSRWQTSHPRAEPSGVVVTATCVDAQNTSARMTTTTCGPDGVWTKQLPSCGGKYLFDDYLHFIIICLWRRWPLMVQRIRSHSLCLIACVLEKRFLHDQKLATDHQYTIGALCCMHNATYFPWWKNEFMTLDLCIIELFAFAFAEPSRPQNLTIIAITNVSASLSWKRPAYTGAGVTRYLVTYQLRFIGNLGIDGPLHRILPDHSNVNQLGDFCELTLSGLIPGCTYTFKVTAIAGSFKGRPRRVNGITLGWFAGEFLDDISQILIVCCLFVSYLFRVGHSTNMYSLLQENLLGGKKESVSRSYVHVCWR